MKGGAAALVALAACAAGDASALSPQNAYRLKCAGCHGFEAKGTVIGGVPPLAEQVGHFARFDEGRRYIVNVPGVIGAGLDPERLAAVLNYVLTAYAAAPDARPFSGEEVARLRGAPVVADPVALRREVVRDLAARGVTWSDGYYPWP